MRDQKCKKQHKNRKRTKTQQTPMEMVIFWLFAKCQKKKLTKWIRKKLSHLLLPSFPKSRKKILCIAVICDFMIWANFIAATLLYSFLSQMRHSFGKYWIGYRREWHELTTTATATMSAKMTILLVMMMVTTATIVCIHITLGLLI